MCRAKSNNTYIGEVWNLYKEQARVLNGILDKIVKQITVLPGTREALYIETDLLDPP